MCDSFPKICWQKFKFLWDMTRITDTLHENVCALATMSRQILLKNTSDKICRENQNAHYMFSNFFFRKSCRLWDNLEKYGRAVRTTNDNIIWRMRVACWITKAADTHSECVIIIYFPLIQGLREGAAALRLYLYCLSCLTPLHTCHTHSRCF